MAIFPFHFGSARSSSDFSFIRFDHRRVVDHDPESAGQPYPGIIRRAKLRRDGSVDFPHIQWAEDPAARASSKLPASLVMKRSAGVRSPSALSRLTNSVVPEDNSSI